MTRARAINEAANGWVFNHGWTRMDTDGPTLGGWLLGPGGRVPSHSGPLPPGEGEAVLQCTASRQHSCCVSPRFPSVSIRVHPWLKFLRSPATAILAALAVAFACSTNAQPQSAPQTAPPPPAASPAPAAKVAKPSAAETREFNAATKAFNDGFFDRVDTELSTFTNKHPQSPLGPQVNLLRGQALFRLNRTREANELLKATLPQAGELSVRHRFWIGECEFQLGNYREAAEVFAEVLREAPDTERRIEAAYREASARYKLGEVDAAIALLSRADGPFQLAARADRGSETSVRGTLLLAEAHLRKASFQPALEAVRSLDGVSLDWERAWLRQYWLARIFYESGSLDEAITSARPLPELAARSGRTDYVADANDLLSLVLAQQGKTEEAIAISEKNLNPALPVERRRASLLRIADLSLKLPDGNQAVQWLERFLRDHPQDSALDVVRLTLGELRLREYFRLSQSGLAEAARMAAQSNQLAQARTQFDAFVRDFPQSPLAGKGNLNRGIALWEDGKLPESEEALRAAVAQLPFGEEQAMARFKLSDALYRRGDLTNAVAGYQSVVDDYATLPAIKDGLFDRALYQIVRASVELNDLPRANDALSRILALYPDSFFSDRSLLMVGQAYNRTGRPAEARLVFVNFLNRFSNSPLAPEAHLAIARTYVQERDWTAAIGKFDDWVRRFPDNLARARAEYDRAWVYYQAGAAQNSPLLQSNAVALFTGVVAQFPANPVAQLAQAWVADHYFNTGDYVNAEKNYQLLFQNTAWPASPLTQAARINAGRAALARQAYKEAQDYFKATVSDESLPPELVATAWFALGDAIMNEPIADAAKALDKYASAINAFDRVVQKFPNDRIVPEALGKIGNCHLQLAAGDPKRFDQAADSYRKALAHPAAVAATRSQAEVGLADTLQKTAAVRVNGERDALLDQAANHCLNVVYGTNLKPDEKPEPYWVKEAGLRAGTILESRGRFDEALKLYERLGTELPPLRPAMEKLMERLRQRNGKPAA